jgi:hypothetical protein
MPTTTTTKTTRKPAAKPAAEVIDNNTGVTADEVTKTYLVTATGRGGKTNTRKVPAPVAYAVDVADAKDGRTPAAKAGLIFRFFSTEAKAKEFADRKRADGYDAIVVPASSKEA